MLSTHQIAPSGATGESTTKSHKNNWGTGDSLSCDQSSRELGWLMLKKAQGNLINLYKSLEGVCREDRAWLFPQTRGDGHKLNTGGTLWTSVHTLITLRLTDHCHRLIFSYIVITYTSPHVPLIPTTHRAKFYGVFCKSPMLLSKKMRCHNHFVITRMFLIGTPQSSTEKTFHSVSRILVAKVLSL